MPANNVATSNDSFISIALAPNSLTRPFVCLILDLNLPLLVNVQGPCATDLVDMLQHLRAEPSRVRITCLGKMVANYRISAEVFRERDPSGGPAVQENPLRVDFAGRRADGTAIRAHPHHREESNIVAGNLSDWTYIIQPARLKGEATDRGAPPRAVAPPP